MSQYNSLKATIDANVKQNGVQAITGQILNAVLNAMVNTLGAGYQFAGVATTATNPGSPDARVFYIANGKGTYTNFGGLQVTEDDVVVLYWDSSWHKVSTGIASQAKLSELEEAVYYNDTDEEVISVVKSDTTTGGYEKKSVGDTIAFNTSTGYVHYERPVSKGERVKVRTYQSTSTSYYFFAYVTDADGIILSAYLPMQSVAGYYEGEFEITEDNAAKLFVQCSYASGRTITITKTIVGDSVKNVVSDLKEKTSNIEDSLEDTEARIDGVDDVLYGSLEPESIVLDENYSTTVKGGKHYAISLESGVDYTLRVYDVVNIPDGYQYFFLVSVMKSDTTTGIVKTLLTTKADKSVTFTLTEDEARDGIYIRCYNAKAGEVSYNLEIKKPAIGKKGLVEEVDDLKATISGNTQFQEQILDARKKIEEKVESGHNCLVFGFLSDSHGTFYQMKEPLDCLQSIGNVFPKMPIFHGGDIVWSTQYPNEEGLFVSALMTERTKLLNANENIYFAKGNHEAKRKIEGDDTSAISDENFYQIAQYYAYPLGSPIFGTKSNGDHIGCWYIDYPESKIRVIAINSYETYNDNGEYKNQGMSMNKSQVDWIYDTLRDVASKTEDWGVIFVAHESSTAYTSSNNITSEIKLIEMFIDKTSWTSADGTKTYTFADLTNGHLVAFIHGHRHKDDIGIDTSKGHSASYNSQIVGVVNGGKNAGGNFGIDIFCCDTTSRELTEYRVGSALRNGVTENVLVTY